MPIPSKVTVTFCQPCESVIASNPGVEPSRTGLCSRGCKWDGSYDRMRPIRVVTYWQRETKREAYKSAGSEIHHSFLGLRGL